MDLIERLRKEEGRRTAKLGNSLTARLREAAAEIEWLRAEVKSLQTLRDVVIENHGYWKDRAERLEEALRDARVMVEDWADYASEYLRSKHDLAKTASAPRDHNSVEST